MDPVSNPEGSGEDAPQLTSIHVRRAARGDAESLAWIVGRFSPLLLSQARYRMGSALRGYCEPEDVVNEVWAVALPRLGALQARDERHTPVLSKFLSTTLLYHVNNLLRRRCTREATGPTSEGSPEYDVSWIDDDRSGAVTRIVREERRGLVLEALDALPERERRILILRGFEQRSNQEAAAELGLLPNTVAVTYRRALEKLERKLPESIFVELRESD